MSLSIERETKAERPDAMPPLMLIAASLLLAAAPVDSSRPARIDALATTHT